MVIPEQLSREPLVRVKPQSKEPVSGGDEIEAASAISRWVETGGNAATCLTESSYVVVDVDSVELSLAVKEALPETFVVSPGGGWCHYYYECSEWTRNVEVGGGTIRSDGEIVVIPPSTHPSSGQYRVLADREVAEIEADLLGRLVEWYTEVVSRAHVEPGDKDSDDCVDVPVQINSSHNTGGA